MDDDDWECVDMKPPDLQETIEKSTKDLIPTKSKHLYEATYEKFDQWKSERKKKLSSESVLLSYFNELSEKYKPTSLWSIYSMLKNTINIKEKIDIGKYTELNVLLKKKSVGFHSKKSNFLMAEHIRKFITEAPDHKYLATKIALIFGICGACRKHELLNIRVQDISKKDNLVVVKIPTANTNNPRFFTVNTEFNEFIDRYQSLRPEHTSTDRFFLHYRNGRCTVQVIGINKFAKMPQDIATFLKLPNPNSYTGNSFRRSSATLLANAGADMTAFKRVGCWKSITVAEGYIEDTVHKKAKLTNIIRTAVGLTSTVSQSREEDPDSQQPNDTTSTIKIEASSTNNNDSPLADKRFTFTNCNVTIINNYTN